jgi:hypothetical protein
MDGELADALAEAARLSALAAEQADGHGTDLVPARGADAEQVRAAMISARAKAASTLAELEAVRKRAKELIEQQRRAAETLLAESTAVLAPLLERVEMMKEGIWTVSLYLGVGEEIVTLADGEPAPAGTPVCVQQSVLAMDEEAALFPETGGMDHANVAQFDEWITADPARVEQLIPYERGVVAIMPRRSSKDYGDPWTTQARNTANHFTYLLIRNGACLHRYAADGFDAGKRLTPARDEFTALFTATRHNWDTGQDETIPLRPGTQEWDRAEKAAGARERHFMRIALILQGLIDRTAVFAPLPAPGLSLLHPEAYEAGHIRLLADDEMALGTGRQPFYDWLADRTAQLRPGMRIAGHFGCQAWRDADERSQDRLGHSRVHPRTASEPVTGQVYTIERRDGTGLVFLYDRTDTVWHRDPYYGGYESGPAQVRASCRIDPASDRFVIPLDLVSIAECEDYMRSRTERHAYLVMFPVLRAVIAAKQAEEQAEEPFRKLITGRLMADHAAGYEDAARAAGELTGWWKLANRWHRPLVTGDPQVEGRALDAISAEYGRRLAAVTDPAEAQTAAWIRAAVTAPMLIARKRDGSWIAAEPQPRDIPGEPDGVWVRLHTWTKTMAGHKTADWVLLEPSRTARWRIIWTGPAWEDRDQAATRAGHLTDPEIREITGSVLASARKAADEPYPGPHRGSDPRDPVGGRPMAVIHDRPDHFELWWLLDRDPYEEDRDYGVPVARLTVTWRRTTGGKVVTEQYNKTLSPRHYTGTHLPWGSSRNHPVAMAWADQDAIDGYHAAAAAREAASAARRVITNRAGALVDAIGAQWERKARDKAEAEFIRKYTDPGLWEDHAKGLRFDCPHLGRHGDTPGWVQAVRYLTEEGVSLAGQTVTWAAAEYTARTGQPAEVPEDIAGYAFPEKKEH